MAQHFWRVYTESKVPGKSIFEESWVTEASRPKVVQLTVEGVRDAEAAFRRDFRAALSRKRLKKVEETPLPMNNPAYFHKIIVHDIKDEVIPDDKHSVLFFETKRFSVERSAVRKAFETQDRLLQRVHQPVRRISLPSLRIYIFGNTKKDRNAPVRDT